MDMVMLHHLRGLMTACALAKLGPGLFHLSSNGLVDGPLLFWDVVLVAAVVAPVFSLATTAMFTCQLHKRQLWLGCVSLILVLWCGFNVGVLLSIK